ncbi:MAG: hypothetical protein P8Z38_09730 [Robiginitalea sp.]
MFLRYLFFGWLMISSLVFQAQEPVPYGVGAVVDSVFLKGQTTESFALYLPSVYDPQLPMPAFFIFDPAARGRLAAETFQKAAESHGWVLIASNDSRNGPYEQNFGQANRLFADVFSRFKIDADHIYVAGFSGGARLATTLAVLSDQIRGVIACGAAFSANPGQIPAPGAAFSYVGVVGTRDMNYQEMRKAGDWLAKIGLPHRIFLFDGRHQWPPEDQIRRAVSWMSFQTGAASPESRPDLFRNYFEGEKSLADSLYRQGRYFESAEEYQKLIDVFGGSFPMDSTWERLSRIRALKDYSTQAKVIKGLGEIEAALRKRFSDRFRKELEESPKPDDFSWWKREKARLDSRYAASDIKEEKDLAARIYNFLFTMPYEASNRRRRKNQFEASRYCARLLTVLFPENTHAQVRLAEEYALIDKPGEMITCLKRARKMGYSDVSAILENPIFRPYKNLGDFPFRSGG